MNQSQTEGLARHILTGIGGYLVATGKLNPEDFASISGAAILVVGAIQSYLAKRKSV